MSPERRREMIVGAAVPLLLEHGAGVSTLQIAKAAGIGEATIFRAFTDKDELLDACVAAVLRNDQVLAELDAVPLDQPLAARLVEAAATLRAYLDRMGAVIGAVHAAGRRTERRAPATGRPAPGGDGGVGVGRSAPGRVGDAGVGREEAAERTRQAIMRLLEPERAALRLPVEQLTDIFLGLLVPGRGMPGGPHVPTETLVDVFLHGVVAEVGPAA
ncbi:TetR family transcriptional regulator [Paractinoplanes toevensis]|uniref:TetR family transcriptional regulator n=2 Tax=Paractinoplanes toevensis TaxID=571911 RepID=A0A919W0B2_9ACTN|nr:TetR family transcriptional regulator [Actinoplanes toevensis]